MRQLPVRLTLMDWRLGAALLLGAAVGLQAGLPAVPAALMAGLGAGLLLARWLEPAARTPRVEAPHHRQELAAELSTLIGLLESPAIALDAQLHAVAFNAQAGELFPGLGRGMPVSRINRHPDLLGALSLVSGDGLTRVAEIVDHAPNGRRLRASVSALEADAEGNITPILLVQFSDLTEQDLLAQMRSDFIANASHELRTPLASLKGFIETLQGPAANDAAARTRFLDIMSAQSARMTRILDDLLSLSRIEMRAHVPPTGIVELNALMREVAQGLEPLAREAATTLHLVLPQEPLRVRGDRDELVQVFQNLVQNAIKYGRENGRVDISLTRDELAAGGRPRVHAVIADDGPGIAAEHLPRLTERFYRVDTAASRARGGTGLGLAIVKHILNRHKGVLRIASEVGKGSAFTVTLDIVN